MREDTLSAQFFSSCVKRMFSLEACALGVAVYAAWKADPSLSYRLTSLFSRGTSEQRCKASEGFGERKHSTVELGPNTNQSIEPHNGDCCVSTPKKGANTGPRFEPPSPLMCKEDAGSKKPDPYSPAKRDDYVSWDEYFMAVAYLSAARSKDPNRQVGACIVGSDKVILGIGYNGFPRGCQDDALPWAKLAHDGDVLNTKYPYVCHAEMNAIMNKNAASLAGASIYVTMYPCNECAKLIIQAGIKHVAFHRGKLGGKDPSYEASNRLFKLAGVEVVQLSPKRSFTITFGDE
mmetsp:Transcript_2407/g.4920  ORF Transcript_2407/g.4920 Transcript_2407/m.4920 type:complete len:291 (-) Transcript_2407:187-1059(-)|eukprot:CAMPEP_0118929180 /NCGR_PEP_ID=MMETSP1169-20130426/6252_1 /TAXON_ID=36882 /ORGANISM="Pyramimonas obovata, Strain CCMP722" /LENGTH=290 /DNA_ID=CAMNT_0006871321 /DNA_START=166 /DNA_END=1038 /DNA_ORIENTATION=-